MFAGIAKYGYSNHETDITIEFASKPLQNIYNTYVFVSIAIYGPSNHWTNITIEFMLKTTPDLECLYQLFFWHITKIGWDIAYREPIGQIF